MDDAENHHHRRALEPIRLERVTLRLAGTARIALGRGGALIDSDERRRGNALDRMELSAQLAEGAL